MTPLAAGICVAVVIFTALLMAGTFLLLRGADRVETVALGAGVAFFIAGFVAQGLLATRRAPEGREGDVPAMKISALERRGEDVYVREGCASCHTQCHRPGEPGGPPSRSTDRPWSRTGLLGVRRIGPDLSLLGEHSAKRHADRLAEPRKFVRDSVMPSYRTLFSRGGTVGLPSDDGRALVAYLQGLGRTAHARLKRDPRPPPAPPLPPRIEDLDLDPPALPAPPAP